MVAEAAREAAEGSEGVLEHEKEGDRDIGEREEAILPGGEGDLLR
jgi:hypothetical protein